MAKLVDKAFGKHIDLHNMCVYSAKKIINYRPSFSKASYYSFDDFIRPDAYRQLQPDTMAAYLDLPGLCAAADFNGLGDSLHSFPGWFLVGFYIALPD